MASSTLDAIGSAAAAAGNADRWLCAHEDPLSSIYTFSRLKLILTPSLLRHSACKNYTILLHYSRLSNKSTGTMEKKTPKIRSGTQFFLRYFRS